ncbi:MAG TPA: CorA family divalent cation transporter [Candidatus Limnocylindrales bacterium]|nr:CorA family divalent cation transporter [Candidatus Limnocylindrales bacterium]
MTSPSGARVRARLFDADRPDERLEPERAFATTPSERQLLWVDLTGDVSPDVARQLAPLIDLQPRTLRQLSRPEEQPHVALHRDYLHVRVAADPSDRDHAPMTWLDVIAGRNVVITHHDQPITFLEDVDARIERDATAGILSDAAFFTIVVDAAIASYHVAVDAIEEDVDRLDADALRGKTDEDALRDLVRCRRRIARLRRLLADHRSVFTALASPELGSVIESSDEAALVAGLAARFEGALSAVEESREALLGSFDVYMSQQAQRTNEVMKVLTLTTVLLLPGSMIAGLLGMNVIVPLNKDDPGSFWLVVSAIAILAVAIVWYARRRSWL